LSRKNRRPKSQDPNGSTVAVSAPSQMDALYDSRQTAGFLPPLIRAVPWHCPACQTTIRHDGEVPAPARVYRCNVCRLELVVDPKTDNLVLAPFQPTDTASPRPVR
jgi:predicted RNA-binding Zn-ribbon protein involved in translation (DUF1610 family)